MTKTFFSMLILLTVSTLSTASAKTPVDRVVSENQTNCGSSSVSDEAFRLNLGTPEYDKAYNLAISEIKQNIRDGYFIAGQGWTQLWTRDTAFSIELGCGLLHPEVSETSLRKCTEKVADIGTCWLQDRCGHFGGWPNLSDAIVGAQGAWALYCISGDKIFLSWAYALTKNSLIRAERDAYDSTSGLFGGCYSSVE